MLPSTRTQRSARHTVRRRTVLAAAVLALLATTFATAAGAEKPTRMPLHPPPATGPKTVQVMKSEEKGSDVNLATYLLVDAFDDDYEAAVVVSNDSDLAEPIRRAMLARGFSGKFPLLKPLRLQFADGLFLLVMVAFLVLVRVQ